MGELINKVTIARMQIEKACNLHLNGDYACALTLAGSSESLTHELVEARGHKSADSWHVKFIRFWREKSGAQSASQKEILNKKNWARNSVKHHRSGEPENIEINLELASYLTIKNSIDNYQSLGLLRTESMNIFNERTRDYG